MLQYFYKAPYKNTWTAHFLDLLRFYLLPNFKSSFPQVFWKYLFHYNKISHCNSLTNVGF